MTYQVRLRKSDGRVVNCYSHAPSAQEAIAKAERCCGGIARSCWPVDWLTEK